MSLSVQLRHHFADFEVDLAFQVPSGISVMFGPSGSGKSTAIRAIAGLMRPTEAQVVLGDRILNDTASRRFIAPHKRRIGTIFQDARLFPHLSVQQNLDFGKRYAPTTVSLAEEKRVIEMLGIEHLLSRRPSGLSGGEAQRVAIGRTLIAQPEIILADEPLSALDAARKAEILPYFERLRDEADIPILYVTHNPLEMARLADRVIVLENGRVSGEGAAVDILSDPSVLPAAAGGALIEAEVVECHADGLVELRAGSERLFVPGSNCAEGRKLRLRVPPHEVMLATKRPEGFSALNVVEGRIKAMHDVNDAAVMVSLDTGAGALLAQITRRSVAGLGLTLGATCYAVIKTVAIAHDNMGFSGPNAVKGGPVTTKIT
ncbi:molybdenum ABC transporter ATP-binding protein [Celeribacter litoreus]|uniref:molybdenum ABC transporter ATP-binding protein n=1 Tax=Celeribacter litoreus TaxID=2876714 RepID=UPI001CC8FBFE|nr:molybdenum ABC transporter ATP-binding protein [Celeribacter litoreus]MCA0042908.1 molybdenum ABC transporter ATP-binding protein [Celeribacter litoreus]